MNYAIIKTGGKQYKVKEGDKISIEKLEGVQGDEVKFNEVLLSGNGDDVKIGKPKLEKTIVSGKILEQGKGEKKIVFKFASKTRYKKKKGHRQPFTKVEITKIAA